MYVVTAVYKYADVCEDVILGQALYSTRSIPGTRYYTSYDMCVRFFFFLITAVFLTVNTRGPRKKQLLYFFFFAKQRRSGVSGAEYRYCVSAVWSAVVLNRVVLGYAYIGWCSLVMTWAAGENTEAIRAFDRM